MPMTDNLLSLFPALHRRRRCGARVKGLFKRLPDGRPRSRNLFCKAFAMPGSDRCWVHGGASTGPRTDVGKARSVAAMVDGRRRWVEEMKAKGQKFPCGRKPGSVTGAVRERLQAEWQEAKRFAALPGDRQFIERREEITGRAIKALDEMLERFKRTGSLL
jgi:hypothetical protein